MRISRFYWFPLLMRLLGLGLLITGGAQLIATFFAMGARIASSPEFILVLLGDALQVGVGYWLLRSGGGRLTRWMLSRAAFDCAVCGYSLQGIQEARCPECGAPTISCEEKE